MEALMTFISSVGFPIVMCIALLWYMIKQNEQHKDESDKMTEAINELKIAVVELTEHLKEA